jgi:hypothetical protein
MDKQFLKDRQEAVKSIAELTGELKINIARIESLANAYGIRVELDCLPATGMNGDAWYIPVPPAEMREDTYDENFDPSGTDWMWESSALEHTYDGEPFGWKNSSSSC